MYISFGDRITLLRKKKKLTQEQLAEQVGISAKELSDYEGDATSPPLNVAIRIADILDTSLDFLSKLTLPNTKPGAWPGFSG